jgi:hypothetical protein
MDVQPAPHSWDIANWPAHVWPGTPARARYSVRTSKSSLIAAGALCRVGRQFVVLGDRYTRWLRKHAARAAKFDIATNFRGRA